MHRKAFIAIIFAAILYGASGVFIKYMSIPASSIAWIRTFIPCSVMAVWMWWSGQPFFTGNYKKVILASLFNAMRMYLFFVAYIYTSIGNAVIIYYTWPIFATLLGFLFLKENISRRQALLLIMAFSGIVIAYSNQEFSFKNHDLIGMTASCLSALLYSVSIIIFKSETLNYSNKELVFYQNFVGMIVFTPFIILNEPKPNFLDIELGISYSFLIGLVAYYLFFYGLRILKASTSSMITYVEVISALFFSYIFFRDLLSVNMVIGGALIILCTALLRKK